MRSSGRTSTAPPGISAAAASPLAASRTASVTAAPLAAKAFAAARPMPLLAPVTMTVRPAMSGRSPAVHLVAEEVMIENVVADNNAVNAYTR